MAPPIKGAKLAVRMRVGYGQHPYNEREHAMKSTIIGDIWVCQCCALIHANGECCADDSHGGDGREPWSAIGNNVEVTAGLLDEQHECGLTSDERSETGCECERREFSWSSCDGCGSSLGGVRYAHTLWTAGTADE